MARRVQAEKLRVKTIIIDVPEELAIDLDAFAEAYYEAPRSTIIRRALREHIDASLDAEPKRRELFEAAKARLTPVGDKIRLIEPGSKDIEK
jgi:predicted transcriptional regulator